MPNRRTRSASTSRAKTMWVAVAASVAALGAAIAPAGLTGDPIVDLVERAAIAGVVTFVGAHGRRWSWIVGAGLLAVPARGGTLALALVGLVVVVASAWPRRRTRSTGAIGIGILVNVPFRYSAGVNPTAPELAIVALLILLVSGSRHLRRRSRRVARVSGAAVGGFAVLATLVAVGAMVFAASYVLGGTRSARQSLNAARNGDADQAAATVANASDQFGAAQSIVDGPLTWPSLLVPGVAQQVRAVRTGVQEGRRVSSSATDLVATADYDRLTYDGQLDLGQIARLESPTTNVARTLRIADQHLGAARAGWLLPPLDQRLGQLSDAIVDARNNADLASDLLQVTPDLLGSQRPRRYLLVFITPAELRGAGGFIGSYAELTASAGKVRLSRSGRVNELITGAAPGTRTLSGPRDYVRRYGRYRPTEQFQDLTLSPDFPSDAQVMAELYAQSGGEPVDGVISVDPTGLAALLKLTGPVEVAGLNQPLSASNAVDILTRTQYLSVPDEAERGEILTRAIRVTFEKLTTGSLPAPRRLADALSPATRGGHLRVWSPKLREERLFHRLGADGSLTIPAGDDGFSVVQQNLGNNKLDAYLHRSIEYRARVDARTGRLKATLVVDLANRVPSLDLPRAVVGNTRGQPIGTNVATISIYTPHRLTGSRIDGRAVTLGPDTELGLNVYDTSAVSIPPGGSVRIELELSGSVDLRNGYHLHVLPQPVANPDRFRASVAFSGAVIGGKPEGTIPLLDGDPRQRPTTVEQNVRRAD